MLVDTPGFDDGERTDEDIFESLADWLKESYNKGQRFNALLYLHKIIANREKGSDLRNLTMFKKLCGEENFHKILLGITWWDQEDERMALARERILRDTPEFWGDMVSKGSRIERIYHDKTRCIQLLLELAENEKTTLRIQYEMAKGMNVLQTTAAEEMEQYKALHAIKDAEEGDRIAQEMVYQLTSQAIEQRASERKTERHRRYRELQTQQSSRIAYLETMLEQMESLEPSRRSPAYWTSELERKIEELAETLRQAELQTQPPMYGVEDPSERMRILRRSRLHHTEITTATYRLASVECSKQDFTWIQDPTGEYACALSLSFCDRCLSQASVKGYWSAFSPFTIQVCPLLPVCDLLTYFRRKLAAHAG